MVITDAFVFCSSAKEVSAAASSAVTASGLLTQDHAVAATGQQGCQKC
jgi:hypothetical protein